MSGRGLQLDRHKTPCPFSKEHNTKPETFATERMYSPKAMDMLWKLQESREQAISRWLARSTNGPRGGTRWSWTHFGLEPKVQFQALEPLYRLPVECNKQDFNFMCYVSCIDPPYCYGTSTCLCPAMNRVSEWKVQTIRTELCCQICHLEPSIGYHAILPFDHQQ